MLPRLYIAAKATIIREYRKQGERLSRKQARDLLKCDVYKTGKIWDFLVRNGLIVTPNEEPPPAPPVLEDITSASAAPNGHLING